MKLSIPDPRAIEIAWEIKQTQQPEITILFGSRARGDYRDSESDINILLVSENKPGAAEQLQATEKAQAAADASYGGIDTPVNLVWRTLAEFRHNRRYRNRIETNAAREGIIMSRGPYDRSQYEDESTEYEPD